MKRRSKCGETKPYSEFHKYTRGGGYQRWCKSCRKVYDHAVRATELGPVGRE